MKIVIALPPVFILEHIPIPLPIEAFSAGFVPFLCSVLLFWHSMAFGLLLEKDA
jgi:hypothetical protein